MISEKEVTRISKFLSLVLRHQPETIGITLDKNGWTDVATLLQQMNKKELRISVEDLQHIIATNNKQRFALSEDKTSIRASQGHSVAVDLGLKPTMPPAMLYHGTGEKYVASILHGGIEKRNRQQVHLSADVETALEVGQRHGKSVVLMVDAGAMQRDGFEFYLSENKVWLTDHVPAKYVRKQ